MKCLYHANCNDGAAAALAVLMKFGDIGHEYIPVQYGEEPPESLEGCDVIMVDFSYKKDQIRKLARVADSILIIDHHKTAKEELKGVDDGYGCRIETVFDMEKSGAVLAWEYFHIDNPIPRLIQHIQDRDLWTFDMLGTREIHQALQLYPDWRDWAEFLNDTEFGHHSVNKLIIEGSAITRFIDNKIETIIQSEPNEWPITKDAVPVYNLPGFMISDTLHKALEKYPDSPYAVGFFDLPDKRVYSLRSRKGSDVDVSKIAKQRGGGGHKHAAGFTIGHRAS